MAINGKQDSTGFEPAGTVSSRDQPGQRKEPIRILRHPSGVQENNISEPVEVSRKVGKRSVSSV